MVYVVILLIHLLWLHSLSALGLQRPSWATMRAILRFGAGSSLADLPSILLGPLLSYLFVVSASSAGDYGVFDLALRIATLSATTLSMLSTPFFAIVAASHAGDAQGQTRRMLSKYLRITLSLGVLGWVVFWVIGTALLSLFFPEQPAEIYCAALIMLAGAAAVAALEPVTRMLMGLGRLRDLAKVRFAMLMTAVAIVWFLSERQPLERFSWAYGLGNLAAFGGLLWLNHREKWGREAPMQKVANQQDGSVSEAPSRAAASVVRRTVENVE
jgi:O-antigen/teichoic acid export membrane protein